MPRLRRIVAEVHRRSLWQVLSIYLIGAWVAYQVILGLTDGIGLPAWVPGFAFVLFLVGLPIVIATAFVNEGPPGRDLLRRPPDLLTDLTLAPELAGRDASAARPTAVPERAPQWLTWRRSLLAGMGAFVLLGAGTTGFMGMRVFGVGAAGTLVAKGVIDARDAIVLADFSSSADPGLASVVVEALRIDLMQTTILRVVDPAYVRSALRMMQHDPADGLDEHVAMQLAQREGLKAVLAGDVGVLGGSYILTARLLSPDDGAVLAAFKEVARDSTRLIDAVDALSKQIRSKAGESLRTVRSSQPLWRVSTASLPALRKYSEAERILLTTGDQLRSAELLEDAIRLDPEFASAYRKLASTLGNLGIRSEDRHRAVVRAYELRDRLTERERLNTAGSYHLIITGDVERAIEAYRAVVDLDPVDGVATNNLALAYARLRRFEDAAAVLRPMIREPNATASHFTNLVSDEWSLGRPEAALAALAEAERRMPANASVTRMRPRILAAQGDYRGADSASAQVLSAVAPGSNASIYHTLDRMDYLTLQGRLAEADRLGRRLIEAAQVAGLPTQVFLLSLRPTAVRLYLLGDRDRALRQAQQLLAEQPLERLPTLDRPYLLLAGDFMEAGDFAAAAAMLERYERDVPPADRTDPVPLARERARLQLRQSPSTEALQEFRRYDVGNCTICHLPEIARGFQALGQPDSAIAVYRSYLETPFVFRSMTDAFSLAPVLEQLGALYEERNEPEQALVHYGRLLELWKDADPELQPRLQAVRLRVQAMGQGRG